MKKLLYLLVFTTCVAYGQKPKVIAHRGGSSMAPENTLAAFNKAIEIKADYYELDVQISSDDSLMIMHDATVDRTTDGTGSLAAMTFAQLRQLDAGSWFSAEFTGEKVPTLYESLALANTGDGTIGIVIELKSSESVLASRVVEVVQNMGLQNRVIVASFSLSQITQVKTLDASIPVMFFATISNSNIDQVAAINGEWVGSGGNYLQTIIDYAHSKGIKYNAWTINSASQMVPLIAQGVDGITTDYPATMISIMDDTEPSDVVLTSAEAHETEVTLNWEEAEDLQSSIVGYDIFRSVSPTTTMLLTSVGTETEYVDQTYTESTQYFYRIKAKNAAGLSSINYSNELSVTTQTDITAPYVKYLTSKGDSTTLLVEFSERVDKITSETKTNYAINHGVTIANAKLAHDQRTIILTTSPMAEQSYYITIKNVKDKANTPNTMVTKSSVFLHQSMLTDAVAIYNLDSIYIQANDTLILDASGNANNGHVKNGASQDEGYLGNALEFDGVNDFVQFETSTSFDFNTSAVTISLWTKLAYLPIDLPVAYGPLFDSEGDQYVLYEDRGNSELRFKVSTSAGAERPGIPNNDLKKGEWIHIVGVYDGTNAMIYLNGVKKDSHPLTGTVKTGQVATLGLSGTSYFEGNMDQVEVYSRALTEDEILEKYNAKAAPIVLNPSTVTIQSVMVDETDVELTWSKAENYESNIMYEIYRDVAPAPTTLYATVGDTISYVDNTNTENQKYYYRVKAKNTRGLLSPDFSNEVEATTGSDITKPVVVYSTSKGDTANIIIEFSEKVDLTSAETITNYSIDQSASVLDAKIAVDQKSVFLTTTKLLEQSYIMTINNIQDLAAAPNKILPDTKIKITHENNLDNLVAWYQLNELPVSGTDTLVIDETENANNGVTKNLPVLAEGLLGNSLKFDGNQKQYVQFESSPSFDINDTMVTLSVWTKLTYLPVEMPMAYGPLFDAQGDQYVLYEDKGNNELRFKVATSAGAERPGIPSSDLVTGQWINVVGVYNGSTVKIYLNGELKDSHNLTGTVNPGIVPLLGLNGTTGTLSYLTGSIDNVQVFKAALSESEVLDRYLNYKSEVENVCESYNLSEDASICGGETYLFPDGTTGTETMVHVSNLKTIYGCDSIITTNLTVDIVDVTVTLENITLTAGITGATYQWLDCDNGNTAISGETSASFTPTVSGNYAVKITENSCTDTSECINVVVSSIKPTTDSEIKIYPNPNNGKFMIDLGSLSISTLKVEIINAQGQVMYESKPDATNKWIVQLLPSQKGLYIIRILTGSGIFSQRLIIN
ncbi:MAG: hypothetical protein A2W95_16450 [Bacteroidetes bacterium GWA2_40_14]|nr:MAG: hypothetical protein A2W95_16450 [Bacteroidetes bacterium GWA2_40_14]